MYIKYTVYAVKRIWRALGSLSVKYSQSCFSNLQLALSGYNQQCETHNPCHHCWNRFLSSFVDVHEVYVQAKLSNKHWEEERRAYVCLYSLVPILSLCFLEMFQGILTMIEVWILSLSLWWKAFIIHGDHFYEILGGSFPLFWSRHKGPFSQQLNIYFLIKFRIT